MAGKQDECTCKVGRLGDRYDLEDLDARLAEEWRTDKSVRRLTEEVNKDAIGAALTAANVGQIEWSRTPVYEALRTDELSETETIEIERELERAGVDVDELSSDLVSHQSVYRHLTECLGASKTDTVTPEERKQNARDTVYSLRQRTELVTQSTVESLRSADIADVGDVDVVLDLQVVCSDCGRSMDFDTAIGDGCDCGGD
ncbi:rod-determining factor RdfA [Haloarchaeobius sp. HRN-SO-5]|uniref:rod-determining factor RdfA n=1 Tax=Haloarchaeobius sp. HRN-SO-5 TaxID=3446118 RepID=UPI003EBE31EE